MELIEQFQTEKVLSNDAIYQALLGKIKGQNAVVLLRFKAQNVLPTDMLLKLKFEVAPNLNSQGRDSKSATFHVDRLLTENNNYFTFQFQTSPLNSTLELIYPASQFHIEKYSAQNYYLVRETPQMYKSITLPAIEHLLKAKNPNAWIDDIIDGKKEQNSVVLRNDNKNFIVISDNSNTNDPHLIIFPTKKSWSILRTFRDLCTEEHVAWIKEMAEVAKSLIPSVWLNLSYEQYACYFHYLPTYFYLHIHIRPVNSMFETFTILLDDVIQNLQNNPKHYSDVATVNFKLGSSHALFKLLVNQT